MAQIMKNSLPKILIFVCVILIGAFTSLICYKQTYQNLTTDLKTKEKLAVFYYEQAINNRTDAYTLTKTGLRQLDTNMPELALISLKRATVAAEDYRDGWLGLGLAQFETGDYINAAESLKVAEALDPINSKTYQLQEATYLKLKQKDLSQTAKTKADFFGKR
jgi:tetratricopeptide (TPR) repeat protein